MNTPQIHLFVQEGCRPCHYVKTQLSKVEGWEDIVKQFETAADKALKTRF